MRRRLSCRNCCCSDRRHHGCKTITLCILSWMMIACNDDVHNSFVVQAFVIRPNTNNGGVTASRSLLSSRNKSLVLSMEKKVDSTTASTETTTTTTVTSSSSSDNSSTVNEAKETSMPSFSKSSSAEIIVDEDSSQTGFRILGIEATPAVLAIMTIYFVEGALGLARLAQTYLLKDSLNLGPAELSAWGGLLTLPWTIKPLYGLISDSLPLWGTRRKSYLMLMGLTGSAAYALLGWSSFWDELEPSTVLVGTVAALLVSSASIAFSDVVADGIVVSQTQQQQKQQQLQLQSANAGDDIREYEEDNSVAGSLQSLCWGSAAVGGLLSAYFSGSLLQIVSVRTVFAITAVLPALVAITAWQMDEPTVGLEEDIATNDDSADGGGIARRDPTDQIAAAWSALRQPSIYKPTLFIFLWQATPTADGAFFFFLSNDLGLGPEFMGRVRLLTALASLGGVVLYNQFLKGVSIKRILYWATWASFPLGLLPVLLITHANRELGIPDQALIYGDDVLLAALGEMAFLPTLVLAARLCPPGVEAVLFATLMSILNGAGTVGTELGAGLTKLLGVTADNFDNLALLTVICNVSSLLPLAAIGWLDDVAQPEAEGSTPTDQGGDGVINVANDESSTR